MRVRSDEPRLRRGKAVQVDSHIRLTLGLKALGFQPVDSTSLSKFWFQSSTCTPYIEVSIVRTHDVVPSMGSLSSFRPRIPHTQYHLLVRGGGGGVLIAPALWFSVRALETICRGNPQKNRGGR